MRLSPHQSCHKPWCGGELNGAYFETRNDHFFTFSGSEGRALLLVWRSAGLGRWSWYPCLVEQARFFLVGLRSFGDDKSNIESSTETA
ncbi:hypothetical protein P154DRAFT_19632 [Amniculicola lignicola CBS 123094]|uniref:Uncharacterized protein n=1 Tax=Amniculicola lignicola CBS 123094 TaxID=1392246 RepID=A0A6A5X0D0_9PLEO|nr:hypothetical protein P154DRAFT_19632 [Amniculicola lignicola CBS 123094]